MGYRQVALVLRNEHGLAISGKTVRRLMREEHLFTKIRKKRYNSYRGQVGHIADNVLKRDFCATEPMKKLVTDVTEFSVAGAKAYLSPVMDLFNNEIIAWSIDERTTFEQIQTMLNALDDKDCKGALLHSDQGWQYQMKPFQKKLSELGIVQSMSRKGNCLDNACMEGFFGHLKDEFYRGKTFESFETFKCELDAYIRYWNIKRYQPKLKGLSPVLYRKEAFGGAA